MLHEEALLKINTAIRQCLDRCYSASDPLAAMAECLDELRENPEWRLAEVDEVECTVRRILQAVVQRQHEVSFDERRDDEACPTSEPDAAWQVRKP